MLSVTVWAAAGIATPASADGPEEDLLGAAGAVGDAETQAVRTKAGATAP